MHSSSSLIPDRAKISWFEDIKHKFECKAEDCELEVDGLWKEKKTGRKFWWRIHPNYCTAGRPFYTSTKEKEIWDNSETKKVLLNLQKTQICLELLPFLQPTDTSWGMRWNGYRVTIYEHGNKIYDGLPCSKRGWKKHLQEFILETYKYNKNHKFEKSTRVYDE